MFSALSPTMASVLFTERPDIMARVLGVPSLQSPSRDAIGYGDVCQQHDPVAAATAHHGNTKPQAEDTSEHATHNILCSFCLAAASMVTMPVAPMHAVPGDNAFDMVSNGVAVRPPAGNLRLTRHPRDPPPAIALS